LSDFLKKFFPTCNNSRKSYSAAKVKFQNAYLATPVTLRLRTVAFSENKKAACAAVEIFYY